MRFNLFSVDIEFKIMFAIYSAFFGAILLRSTEERQ
jgi:hypothetical protein